MTITTRDQLISALANNASRVFIDKASLASTVAGQFFSFWTSAGSPSAGVAPTAAAVPTSATVGAMPFVGQTSPVTSYLAQATVMQSASGGGFEIHDRLAHMGGLSGTVTTAQGALSLVTTAPSAERLGAADYSDVQWWLEVYTAMGTTSVNATVNVTYGDGTTANLTAFLLGATPRVGRMYPLTPAAGKRIRSVNSVTLSATTGAAGNFGITATRPLATLATYVANKPEVHDWAQLGLPEVPNDACLQLITQCSTTTTGTVRGQLRIAHG